MADQFNNLRGLSSIGEVKSDIARESAVRAALILIQSKVGNSPERTSILKDEMEHLSAYADKIQAALKG